MTVKFWHWHNGSYVRLTLREGKSIRLTTGGPNEEGYDITEQILSIDRTLYRDSSPVVVCHVGNESRDCDGRYSSSRTLLCPVTELNARNSRSGELPTPEWVQEDDCDYRDYSAEAAGY